MPLDVIQDHHPHFITPLLILGKIIIAVLSSGYFTILVTPVVLAELYLWQF
jgi:hypothetical protein